MKPGQNYTKTHKQTNKQTFMFVLYSFLKEDLHFSQSGRYNIRKCYTFTYLFLCKYLVHTFTGIFPRISFTTS